MWEATSTTMTTTTMIRPMIKASLIPAIAIKTRVLAIVRIRALAIIKIRPLVIPRSRPESWPA